MAKKRRVESEARPPIEEQELSDLPLWMQEQSWSDWFKRVLASRLFALGSLAFDVFLGLELVRDLNSEIEWVVLPIIAFFIALQVTIYLFLWGAKGRLM
jgi:hypothetical protein